MFYFMFMSNAVIYQIYITVLLFFSNIIESVNGEIHVFARNGREGYVEPVFSVRNEFWAFKAQTASEDQLVMKVKYMHYGCICMCNLIFTLNTTFMQIFQSYLTVSEPISACSNKLKSPPEILQETTAPTWYLLADDTVCSISEKIINAQNRGYKGLIIYPTNDRGNPAQPWPFAIELNQDSVRINVFFIGKRDGLTLKLYQFLPGKSFQR